MTEGFRPFRVVQKIRESTIITSFYLEPLDEQEVTACKPGQYITVRVPGADGKTVLKTYSVSSNVTNKSGYRITVKKEGAPVHAPDAPPGIGSCYLHDQVDVGSILEVAAPRGEFYLNEASDRPVLLLSGGVGLTPLVSMFHSLIETQRPVFFLHACENGDIHALRDEILNLSEGNESRVKVHFVYRAPTPADIETAKHHSVGYITKELLQSLLPLDDYEVYFCGPTPFMKAMYNLTRSLGISEARISYEFFGSATSLVETASIKPAPDQPPQQSQDGGIEVVFAKSGVTGFWHNNTGSLLEFAEDLGLAPEFSCRSGICSTCMCPLLEGEVTYIEDPLEDAEEGNVLICCSQPRGRIVLDI
jgi:uncharacterized protein